MKEKQYEMEEVREKLDKLENRVEEMSKYQPRIEGSNFGLTTPREREMSVGGEVSESHEEGRKESSEM